MSTNERPRSRRPRFNAFAIVLLVAFGLVTSGLLAVDGAWVTAAVVLLIAVGIAVALAVLANRNDTVAMLTDDIHEERNVHIHQRAALVTLNIVAGVIVVAGVVDIARGGDGDPYFWLAAVTGVTYLVSLLVINRRS